MAGVSHSFPQQRQRGSLGTDQETNERWGQATAMSKGKTKTLSPLDPLRLKTKD